MCDVIFDASYVQLYEFCERVPSAVLRFKLNCFVFWMLNGNSHDKYIIIGAYLEGDLNCVDMNVTHHDILFGTQQLFLLCNEYCFCD